MRLDTSFEEIDEAGLTKAEIWIGTKIKERRQARHHTLQALGQKTGLSRSFLSKLENGKVSPSVPTLLKVAQALDTTIGTFLDGLTQVSEKDLVVVRSSQRPVVARGGSSFGYSYERLAHPKNSGIEVFVVRFTRGRKPLKPFLHAGYEFNFVLKGQIELVQGDQRVVLEEGDSAYYRSSVPHYGVARGCKEAEVLAILIASETQHEAVSPFSLPAGFSRRRSPVPP
ncbi:MAG: XRE family transcriptional regulator [Chloroflexi bacterium]|nr:XRE family transcriptional regulator [Chloroflexota bacterium]